MNSSTDNPLTIIAGPCSVDKRNIEEIYQISELKINGQPAIAGTRVVGLKSRTSLNPNGEGMGMDYHTVIKNQEILVNGGRISDLHTPPSIILSREIIKNTGMMVGTEVMLPLVQIPPMLNILPDKKVLLWSPAVNQLGWPITQTAQLAKSKNWMIGIKNGKWIGDETHKANSEDYTGHTPLEKTWAGLADYAKVHIDNAVLIHRGVDVPDKKNYRNLPVHEIAKRTKLLSNCKIYFDPSHSYGPKMREDIVPATIEAMKLKDHDGNFLYDGILVEAGTSITDTEQHISIKELKDMIERLSQIRKIVTDRKVVQHTPSLAHTQQECILLPNE